MFRKYECFPYPNLNIQCGKQALPRLLEVYPCAKEQIVSFGLKNLSHLTIELVYQFLHSTVIPRLAALWKKESIISVALNGSACTSATTS